MYSNANWVNAFPAKEKGYPNTNYVANSSTRLSILPLFSGFPNHIKPYPQFVSHSAQATVRVQASSISRCPTCRRGTHL